MNRSSSTSLLVHLIDFKDVLDLPHAHTDARRTIYERSTQAAAGFRRTSRSVVNASEAILGNHYHDFNQTFKGQGRGVLYTAPKHNPADITAQALPAGGWAFAIPAGVIMALRLEKDAIVIFESDQAYQDGAHTHRAIIAR